MRGKAMSGIIELKGYTFWHKVDVVSDYVYDFLEEKFNEDIVFPELFSANYFILGENLPVEVQATRLQSMNDRTKIAHSYFEQNIEKQIKQNIERFGLCWLIIDSEYVRYLQNELTKGSRVNYSWSLKFILENKLKVIGLSFDGRFQEYAYEDLKFLNNLSTGKTDEKSDSYLLEKNRFKIMHTFLRLHNFTTEEIEEMRKKYANSSDFKSFLDWTRYERNDKTDRESIYGNILYSLSKLSFINSFFDFNVKEVRKRELWFLGSIIGFFEVKGQSRGALFKFKDKFGLAEYFPAYQRNKHKWDTLKDRWITSRTLKDLIIGKIDITEVDFHKEQFQNKKFNEAIENKTCKTARAFCGYEDI